jgi:hypothetical protein
VLTGPLPNVFVRITSVAPIACHAPRNSAARRSSHRRAALSIKVPHGMLGTIAKRVTPAVVLLRSLKSIARSGDKYHSQAM